MPLPLPGRVRRHHRPPGHTHRLWSVRTQLLAPILVATAGLVVLGAAQTDAALAASADADRARVLAGTATATVRLVHELERELGETAALRQRGGTAGRPLVDAQRRRVDAAIDRYRSASGDARRAAPDLAPVLNDADGQLGQLDPTRKLALAGDSGDPAYVMLVDSLLAVADALPAQLRDAHLANGAREVAAMATQEHLASLERDLLRGVFVRGALAQGELVRLGRLRGAREQRQAEFLRIAIGPAKTAWYRVIAGGDVETARRMRDDVLDTDGGPEALKTDGDAWYVAQSGTIRRYNLLGRELSEDLDRDAAALARAARQRALLTAGGTTTVALASLATAVLLAVRTSRRLRRLRVAALTMANRELPERITAIAAGEGSPGDGTATRLTAGIRRGRDEVAQVAEAFDTVNKAALRLAGEQAELRLDVTRMAEALARRIRTLITRQLRLLDDFEREETDPDALDRFFALDHLAARLRRNGENLLVLAGGEPGRGHEGALLLDDAVRAAASEIEDYPRVEVDVPTAAVHGAAVGNLVHLLAELLENATVYSPPEAPVLVDGRRTVDGVTLRVHDQGIGISESRLAEINERLAAPAALSSAAAGSMGLHVVAHLAARHGIRVQLHHTDTGTIAQVEVPESALTRVESATRRPDRRPTASGGAPWFRPGPAVTLPLADARDLATSPLHPTARHDAPTVAVPVIATRPPAAGSARGVAAVPPPGTALPAPAAAQVRPAGGPPTPAAGGPLPRRTRGGQLPATMPATAPPPRPADDLLDPEVVRARLSALAEGVASATRRTPNTTPTGRNP
ncbi:nitrate- and nitrite sensing domain-containing protein [Micromonospora sp. DR5-3]|uniref:sensor histidine kinase n=1 Tax=unclassified Micromonospora TaxID=2617518 RepID=UPI0011DC001B|nr:MULTISPECIES: nitrate- and nitrite sensing domain-containing protein [unclassified Micromonospora]MCW3817650.1 nitrate- and nitrite sensing domain-containing protein [Micromonospora sp. DR5-3]TYC20597.1 ATP-binding protein [Micromonospora sp. MP36]